MPKPSDVDRDDLIAFIRKRGAHADHALAYYRDGERELLRASLEHGADADGIVRPRLKRTLLQEAALEGPEDLFGEILSRAKNLEHRNSDQDTALHCAMRDGSGKKAKALIQAGAKANARNIAGLAPINMLQWVEGDEDRAALAQAFVASGVSLDVRSAVRGTAPLHEMARLGDQRTAQILIEAGAICRIRDGEKRRPSEIARAAGQYDMAAFLDGEEERERLHGKILRQKVDRQSAIREAAADRRHARQESTSRRHRVQTLDIS